ncbi:MAG TPA: AAA family ATPase [Haliangium sp.]|nr:AAA family ATPase [Haliangium sp.]
MLTRIHIENYRCFRKFEFKPGRFTLLLGANGTGKSSLFEVLHCIYRLQSGWSGVDELFPAWSRYRDDPEHPQRFTIDATLKDESYRYELVVEHDRRARARIAGERVRRGGQLLYEFDGEQVRMAAGASRKDEARLRFKGTVSPLALMEAEPASPLARFLQWLHGLWVIRPVPQSMRAMASGETSWLSPDLSNFAAWFQDLVQEHPRTAQRIMRSLKPVLPGLQGYTLVGERGRPRTLQFLFRGHRRQGGGPSGFALDELSDGQRMLVALYALLYVVVGKGLTLCIDEPDNYVALPEIQPWLDELRDLVVAKGGQVLLISHHPRLIDLFAAHDGYWLDRKGTGPVKVERVAITDSDVGVPVSDLVARGWIDG